jgi:hypothetical protein
VDLLRLSLSVLETPWRVSGVCRRSLLNTGMSLSQTFVNASVGLLMCWLFLPLANRRARAALLNGRRRHHDRGQRSQQRSRHLNLKSRETTP